jgi:hypothetical protein
MKRILTLLLIFAVSYISAQPKIYTPSPLLPTDAATNQMPDVTISWSAVTGVGIIKYKLLVDEDPGFLSPHIFNTEFLTGVAMADLLYNTTYYWKVKAYDAGTGDSSYWSTTRSFKTFEKLENRRPTNKDKNQAPVLNLEWRDRIGPNLITGNTFFNYIIDTTTSFNSPLVHSANVAGTVYKASTPRLRFGTRYYWKVRAINQNDTSSWTDPWYFRTLDTIKQKDPANNAINQQLNLKLNWDKYQGITRYDYELSTTPTFEDALHYITENNIVTPAGITFGVKYFWRVRGRHLGDTTSWGETRAFTTIAHPNLKVPANGAANVSTQPEFSWDKMGGISFFLLQYDTDPNFGDGFLSNNIGDTLSKYRCPYQLENNTVYYWRMRAVAGSDSSAWSPAFSFTTAGGVGISDPAGRNTVQIFPNPARNNVSVRFPEGVSGIGLIRIMDLLGQSVMTKTIEISGDLVKSVDISGLRGGIYMLKAEIDGKVFLQKMIIDK